LFEPNLGVFREGGGKTSQNKTFQLLNVESLNAQCKKLFVRQLFDLGVLQSLGVLQRGANPILKVHYPKDLQIWSKQLSH